MSVNSKKKAKVLSDLWEWINDAIGHWRKIVTGSLITSVVAIVEHRRSGTLSWAIVQWGLALSVGWALFSAWRDKKLELAAAQQELADARELSSPKITTVIDSIVCHALPTENAAGVIAVATARNTGAPSVAENWKMRAVVDGVQSDGEARLIPPSITCNGPEGSITYYGKDALYNVTKTSPIPSGGSVTGVFWSVFKNAKIDQIDKMSITLQFTDVTGKAHESEPVTLTGDNRPMYVPGLGPPVPSNEHSPL